MKKFIQNDVTLRFIDVYNKLNIKNKSNFCRQMEYSVQSFNEIMQGRRNIPIEILRKFVNIYDVDINYLFGTNNKEVGNIDLNELNRLQKKIIDLYDEKDKLTEQFNKAITLLDEESKKYEKLLIENIKLQNELNKYKK